MKKLNLLVICITLIATSSQAQYWTVKLGAGYGWSGIQQSTGVLTFQPGTVPDPAYSNIIPLLSYATSDSTKSKYKENVYDGYGRGFHLDFGFGYMFNPYFGIQIDGAYLYGEKTQATQVYDDPLLGKNNKIVTKTYSQGLSLNPSLVFRAAKPEAKVAPYARLGIALPISGAIYHNLAITSPNSVLGNVTADINVKTESTISVGFQGAMGISFRPIPLVTVWGEVSGQYLFARAKEATLQNYDVTDKGNNNKVTSYINDLGYYTTEYSKVTRFVDRLDENSNTEIFGKGRAGSGAKTLVDETRPRDELRQTANIGVYGFSVGVTFNMSKKIFKDLNANRKAKKKKA